MSKLVIYSDGASQGNPGDAGIGVVITFEDGSALREVSEFIGTQTNNFAEYSALIVGLRAAKELGANDVEVRTDSELLVRQIAGSYKVKSGNLQPLHGEAMSLLRSFQSYQVTHISRERNRRADQLASKAAKRKRGRPEAEIGEAERQPKPRPRPEFEI